MGHTTRCCQTLLVQTPCAMHLRPSARLAKLASCFESSIVVYSSEFPAVDAKCLLSILMLGATAGSELTFSAMGRDARDALATIAKLFASGLVTLPSLADFGAAIQGDSRDDDQESKKEEQRSRNQSGSTDHEDH
jgi:phosphocarrier protein